eukprot:255426_1
MATFPMMFLACFGQKYLSPLIVKYKGLKSKVLIDRKAFGNAKKRRWFFYIKYVKHFINKTETYLLYERRMQIMEYFYNQHEEHDCIEVKYLEYIDTKDNNIVYHDYHVLQEHIDDDGALTCDMCKYFAVIVILSPWFLLWYWLSYLWAGAIGIIFTLLNSLLIYVFFRYIMCPFVCIPCRNGECNDYKNDPFWVKPDIDCKGKLITEDEYNSFLETLENQQEDSKEKEIAEGKSSTKIVEIEEIP